MEKCHFPNGIVIKPDGVHELDPCQYEVIEAYKNVTVHVLKCTECGHVEIDWFYQDNTEQLNVKEES